MRSAPAAPCHVGAKLPAGNFAAYNLVGLNRRPKRRELARSRYELAERPPLPSCDNFCFCLKPLPAFVLRRFCERSRFFFMALSASPSPWPDACERRGASVSRA